jgi:predicted Zn-dependent peptidase
MLALGRTALFFDEVETIEEVIANIQELTADELLDIANEMLRQEAMSTLIYSRKI